MDSEVQAILDYADISLIDIPVDEPVDVYFIATIDGRDRKADGSRMVTHVPFQIQSDAMIGIQRISNNQLGIFASNSSSTGLKWIINDIGPLEGTKSTGPNNLPYSGGPRILFSQPPLPERNRPAIQVFMVSDISKVPSYNEETNSYVETTSPAQFAGTTNNKRSSRAEERGSDLNDG